MIERQSRVGGLAKSYDVKGHIFDTGPKRFHTDDPIVLDFIEHILREDTVTIGRSTKVHFLEKYFTWPLQPKDVLKLPPSTSIRCFIDLIRKEEVTDKDSFHQFICSKYGETLYSLFFKPYTEKFLRWDSEDIHSDWASTGINRTVIDKRIKANSLFDLVKSISLPEKMKTEFIYPRTGGFGSFFDKLFSLCQGNPNFSVLLQDRVVDLKETGTYFDGLTEQAQSFRCNHLIWSGNLNDLMDLVLNTTVKLNYLNTIFYNLICKDAGINSKHKAQWIYVSKGDTLISRLTCMQEFSRYTCPEGYYNIICELTDSQKNPTYFDAPERFREPVISELVSMGFLKGSKYVEEVFTNPVVDTYPIYHRRFHHDFTEAVRSVKKFSKRLHLLGRTGAFWYNNSDHSIRMAIDMAKYFLGQATAPLDYRGYFGGRVRSDTETVEAIR